MPNPIITISLETSLITGQTTLQIKHIDVEGGWPSVAQLLVQAQGAAIIEAFKQIIQPQTPILLTHEMPREKH